MAQGNHRDMSEFRLRSSVCPSAGSWDRFLADELKRVMAGN